MREIEVSVFERATATQAHTKSMTFDALVARLSPSGTSKDGAAICGAVFDPPERKKSNVQKVHALILDIDEAEGSIGELTRPFVDFEAVLWTTWSHTDDKRPKFRHMLPLTRPVDPEEYAALWQWANKTLGGIVDPATKDASRLQYLPRQTGLSGEPARVIHHRPRDAKWLDPDALPDGQSLSELVERMKPKERHIDPAAVTSDEISSALEAIDPSRLTYQEWLSVGMALHDEGLDVDVWERWSSSDPRHQPGDCANRWDGFGGNGVTVGSLFHLAMREGWTRPHTERRWMLDDLKSGDGRIWYEARNEARVAEHLLDSHKTEEPVIYDLTAFWQWDDEKCRWSRRREEKPGDFLAETLHRWQREQRMWLQGGGDKPDKPYMLSAAQQKSVVAHCRVPAQRPGFFESAPDGIAFADVFLRVQGREIVSEPSGPHQRQRHAYAWAYDESAQAPETEKRIREILKGVDEDDTEARVQMWWQFCGAALLGIAPQFLKALVLYGRKGSGKSTLMEILTAMMPSGSVDAVSPHDFGDDKKVIAFADMRLNAVGELRHERPISNHTIVKSIIGGELVTARDVYRSAITFRPSAAHLWCANRLPQLPGVDGSWWDRIMMLHCHQSFRGSQKEKRGLAGDLVHREIAGIVRLAIEGARSLLKVGRYLVPDTSVYALDEWQESADGVALFLAEACTDASELSPRIHWSRPTDVHTHYLKWAQARQHNKMSHHELMERLMSRGVQKTRSNGARLSIDLVHSSLWDDDASADSDTPF